MTKPMMIISAELEFLSKEENARRSANLVYKLHAQLLGGTRIVPCLGSYYGVLEQSYAVYLPEEFIDMVDTVVLLHGLAEEFNQESIVVVNKRNQAMLTQLSTGEAIKKGAWTEIPDGESPSPNSWTQIGDTKYQIGILRRKVNYSSDPYFNGDFS